MRHIILSFLFALQSCAGLQPVADDIEKMVDNDAITIKVDKDAINQQTDVSVQVEVKNKEIKP